LWLDVATGLPLRRQLLGQDGRVLVDVSLAKLMLGRPATAAVGSQDRPWGKAVGRTALARLRAQGWPLPAVMPGGLVLLDAREDTTAAGPVVGLDYTDGLTEVTVFLQRGHLRSRLAGWTRVAMRGHHVYADEPAGDSVAWSAHGFVYTVATTSSSQVQAQVVAALPHGGTAGFLTRVGDGLHRLLAWLSP
ncbi:MAG TPA: hypothetical protein VGS19_30465, partial [Streptosporangiaceae bacterium]|nr:hypothetical protein [Streptosporangiaceae bacterium]